MLDLKRLRRFLDKDYRDTYLETIVRSSISYQIRALRSKLKLSQSAFSREIEKPQSVVSRLENSEYGKVTVQTLIDVATALDVALVVRFVDYPTFFRYADRMSEFDLQADNVRESLAKAEAHINQQWNDRIANQLNSAPSDVRNARTVLSALPQTHGHQQSANSNVQIRSAHAAYCSH